MPKTLTLETQSLNPSLLSFKPRPVLLLSNSTTAMKSDRKQQLLLSIANYLQRSGFSKTLKKFLKEAKLQKDDLGSSLYDLEKDFCEFLDTRDDAGHKVATKKTEALQAVGSSEGDGDGEFISSVKDTKAKTRKVGSTDNSGDKEKITESKNAKEKKSEILKNNGEVVDTMPDKKQKEKKKKNKLDSESPVVKEEHHPSELLDKASKGRKEESKVDSQSNVERKDKKKKTRKSSDTGLDNGNQDEVEAKQDKLMPKQDGGKKRKRSASENDAEQPADKKVVEESKRRKTEVSEKFDRNGHVDNEAPQKVSGKGFDAQANGNLFENGENSAVLKSGKKQQNGSAELHTAKRFQRIKVEEVVFSDERLKNNSYWAKDGAEIGYGAKAEEVLGQVKGRDFRHEKTKKKRGSYRGGQIDLQSHSVKFNYSDDE